LTEATTGDFSNASRYSESHEMGPASLLDLRASAVAAAVGKEKRRASKVGACFYLS